MSQQNTHMHIPRRRRRKNKRPAFHEQFITAIIYQNITSGAEYIAADIFAVVGIFCFDPPLFSVPRAFFRQIGMDTSKKLMVNIFMFPSVRLARFVCGLVIVNVAKKCLLPVTFQRRLQIESRYFFNPSSFYTYIYKSI